LSDYIEEHERFHVEIFYVFENAGVSEGERELLRKMSQVPQKSARIDQKLRGKNYFGEARGSPGEPEFAT